VRKDKRFNMTPFVFLSVLDDLDDQIKGLSQGVDDYLTKPITPQQLLARVNTALARTERLKQNFFRNPVNDLETEAYLRQRLSQETERCRKFERPLSMLVFGIGNYVALVRGHAEWFAELAAARTGAEIRKSLRSFDLIADMGQGRFAVLMPETSADKAKVWAEKLKEKWSLSLVWPETEQNERIDIGFTVDALSPGDDDPVALLKKRLESFERKW